MLTPEKKTWYLVKYSRIFIKTAFHLDRCLKRIWRNSFLYLLPENLPVFQTILQWYQFNLAVPFRNYDFYKPGRQLLLFERHGCAS